MTKFKELSSTLGDAFPGLETSFQNLFSSYYIVNEYPKSINKKVGIHPERKLYRLISFGGYNSDFENTPHGVKISVSVTFSIYEPASKSYAIILPAGTKLVHCPRCFDVTDEITFSEATGEFYKKGKAIDITKYLRMLIEKNERVLLPFRGLPQRLGRRFRWYFIAPLAAMLSKLFDTLFFICSGKKLSKENKSHPSKFFLAGAETEKLVVENELSEAKQAKEIDFFGMKAKPAPLITYATINLAGYVTLYNLGIKPSILKTLFGNAFLSILYVVVSYSLLEFGFGRLFHWLSQLTLDLENAMETPEKQGYVR